jgi:HAE1 family hydrophobic/amphiphilic exporter-1
MAFARGEGAEMRQPLAITIMSGLLSSTLLTLFIIPMLYYLFTAREKSPAE